MKKRIMAGLMIIAMSFLAVIPVKANTLTDQQLAILAAIMASPQYKAAMAAQANQAAAAANQQAIATQKQADMAMLQAVAATQQAFVKQDQANQAAILAVLANQAALNTIILNNPVLLAQATKPKAPVDPKVRNLELLHNINSIDQANLAAVNARAVANTTLSRLNDIKARIDAIKADGNPGLIQQLNELNAMAAALEAQYKHQDADACAKEATLKKLQATLPTAGYNPCLCDCYY
ncbi:MAG: hypothetical protein K6E63_03220 [Lachnospiraceae bacterium]|nr:hypothetical protein [Lachnospiraceae bacterium]